MPTTMMSKKRRFSSLINNGSRRQRSIGLTTTIAAVMAVSLLHNVDSFALPQPTSTTSSKEPCTSFSSASSGIAHLNHVPTQQSSRSSPTKPKTKTSLQAVGVESIVVGSAIVHMIGGSLATPFVIDSVKTWYGRIPLPSWTPPNQVFAPVWTFLYGSLGVAVARVASASAATTGGWKSLPVLAWVLHYFLNLSWAPLFFGMAKLRTALVVNYLMVASMPFLIKMYAAVDRTAAVLLIPYTAWLVFATILNQAICKLNPVDEQGYSRARLEKDIAKLQKEAAKKVGLMEKAKKMGVF